MSQPARQLSCIAAFVLAIALAGLLGALAGRLGKIQATPSTPFVPNDAGTTAEPGGWTRFQWNFAGPYGVDAPGAWGNLIAAGSPGGAGVTVAVLDTGVDYAPFHRSPDLRGAQFVAGYDFVDGDSDPIDPNGHGTHVTSTIAEQTNNRVGLTGLAYGVRIMPVRVLDENGDGNPVAIARGIRLATDRGAKVINLSFNFDTRVTAPRIARLLDAIDYAHRRGVLIVAGSGNAHRPVVAYPARAAHVLSVGATTEYGCLSSFSNVGSDLDLVAPGGGSDAYLPDDAHCQTGRAGRPIYQVLTAATADDPYDIEGYIGTSMASPHVAAAAALVVASGVIGDDPSPREIELRLEQTARDLGPPGYDNRYGWGLINAGAATAPGPPRRPSGAASSG